VYHDKIQSRKNVARKLTTWRAPAFTQVRPWCNLFSFWAV